MILIKTNILNVIEKALRGSQRDKHKYIFRREVAEKTSGKSVRRYEYVYEEDRKLHPLEMLKKFFGISQKEVDTDYEKGNIQKDFGADKPTFAQHLLEYFCHRSIWDKRFAKKDNQDKFKKPVKMQTFKETASTVSKDMETPEAESEQPELFSAKEIKPQGEKAWKANPYLMRKIWGMYTGKTVEQQKKQSETAMKIVVKKESVETAKNALENYFKDSKEVVTDKTKTKVQILKDVIKPQLFDLGIIPHSQIEATSVEQLDNVKTLLEAIQTMPKLGDGNYEAKLHYFVGGMDYYITELGDNGEAYGYCDNNGDPQMSEWGYIDLKELAAIGDFKGLNIDYFFKPKLVGDLIKESGHKKLYEHYSEIFGKEEAKLKSQDKKILEKESGVEAHENRSRAMMGNQNAKKMGLTDEEIEFINGECERFETVVSASAKKKGFTDEQVAQYVKDTLRNTLMRNSKINIWGAPKSLKNKILSVKNKQNLNFAEMAKLLYNDYAEAQHGENNSGTGRNGLSNNLGNIRSGKSKGNGGTDVLETESSLDGNEFVQQPRESGIGLGEPTSDVGRGAGSGRVTKATAKQIREKCLNLLASKKDSEMTVEDKALLAQYEGGGGLNEGGQSTKAVLTEFYTPRDVISKVWELVDKYNPNQKKKVLEPSSGIGRFAEGRSEDFTLCEIDETSARIAGILHPDSEIKQGAFQNLFMKNNVVTGYKGELYDVVIGNPPYGAYNDLYKGLGEGEYHARYEEYFIDRSLDTLKEGGILAFVVPSSFLRSKGGKGKEAIAKKGKLLEAWRLPKGTFSSTDVGTDIIIIQKGKGDIADYCDNKYFKDNEPHVIGNETETKDRFGKPTKVVNLTEGKIVAEE